MYIYIYISLWTLVQVGPSILCIGLDEICFGLVWVVSGLSERMSQITLAYY